MTPELWQDVVTAAAQLAAFWLVVKAELRGLWRAHESHEKRIDRIEVKILGG